ncbi:MAG: hypothetical protein J5726_00100 [Treponema sp.]|nr:hypothetical protein [Treponema sp.]
MKRFISFCTVAAITILFFSSVFAAESKPAKDIYEDVFLYAQRLEQGGAFEEAEVEYKRYIFLQDYSAGLYQTRAFESLAGLYAQKEQWQLAADTMNMAIQSSINDGESQEQTDQLRLRHIQYLSHIPNNLYLFGYINFQEHSKEIRHAAFLADFKQSIDQGLWLTAQEKFYFAEQNLPDVFTAQDARTIDISLDNIMDYKPKKQLLAGYLSFIPGLGQLYAGDAKDALNAFVLNGSLIAVSVWSICTLDVWTFSLLEFNPLIHFMQGNMYNAQKDVYEYNQRKINELSSPIKEILQ